MVETEQERICLVKSLRRHVLTPLSDAQSFIQREYEEVEAERQAFQQFKECVASIDIVSPPSTVPRRRTVSRTADPKPEDQLRNAYRETVMSVSHYDDVYGESLDTNFTAELSITLPGQQRDSPLFTEVYKTELTAAVSRVLAQRETFCDSLQREQNSLANGREELTDLLDNLDGPRIPSWHAADFEKRLSRCAQTRQETLQTRDQSRHTDGHDLCSYLYREPAWTYPVLTAVARLRGAVNYRS